MQKHRCGWCEGDDLYEAYHDLEWGVPLKDDGKLFEFLVLETFQAGLSWITILRKRENFRKAFDNFDYKKIATYQQTKIDALLQDTGIISTLGFETLSRIEKYSWYFVAVGKRESCG